ncbi:glycosyltransferase family 2 protein [Butyrivibrio sp.]|uniref:glycosyltransferase family 2 protein n=1 Tax=Butyrivibrio sp. TaxID=28121 RepID=UPI002ECFE306
MRVNDNSWRPSYWLSIIMVAYNSENTIEYALKSIRSQSMDQNQIELLVLDGGSSDRTVELAHKYNAVVLHNEAKLPEPGKIKGMQCAHGKYVLIMDSDEELPTKTILQDRYDFLEKYDYLHCISIGTVNPPNYNPIGKYINAVGDPFSCFVYRTYKLGMNKLIWDKNTLDSKEYCIGKFGETDIRPIGDSGVMMDMEYIHRMYPEQMQVENTTAIFDHIIRDTGYVGCILGDDHIHRSKSDFRTYLKKLKFRVVNNVHNVESSGYGARSQSSRKLTARKFLFPLYVITIIPTIFDGVRMSINYSSPVFMLHPVFAWYVLVEILHQYFLKIISHKQTIDVYGE